LIGVLLDIGQTTCRAIDGPVTADDQPPGTVQLADPATAIHPLSDRTHEPGPLSTEPARRPFDADTALGFDVDGRPARHPWSSPTRITAAIGEATSMPFQHIDGPATLDGVLPPPAWRASIAFFVAE
jgi:hypothetical protein